MAFLETHDPKLFPENITLVKFWNSFFKPGFFQFCLQKILYSVHSDRKLYQCMNFDFSAIITILIYIACFLLPCAAKRQAGGR